MAIATLAECFDSPAVFRTNVKIRKGLALRLMRNATSMAQVRAIFREFCAVIAQRAVACCGDRLHVSVTLAKVDRWMVEDARKDDETKSSTLGR